MICRTIVDTKCDIVRSKILFRFAFCLIGHPIEGDHLREFGAGDKTSGVGKEGRVRVGPEGHCAVGIVPNGTVCQ